MTHDKPLPMTRRDAALTFGTVVTALMIPACASAPAVPALAWAPKALSPGQALALDALAEVIVPASDTPGAREAGVPHSSIGPCRTIARRKTPSDPRRTGPHRRRRPHRIRRDLCPPELRAANLAPNRYEAEAQQPRAPLALAPGDTETGLSIRTATPAPAPGLPHFFSTLKELVTVGYFTSQLGRPGPSATIQCPAPIAAAYLCRRSVAPGQSDPRQ